MIDSLRRCCRGVTKIRRGIQNFRVTHHSRGGDVKVASAFRSNVNDALEPLLQNISLYPSINLSVYRSPFEQALGSDAYRLLVRRRHQAAELRLRLRRVQVELQFCRQLRAGKLWL